MELTPTDRKLLTLLQGPFPLVSRPFAVLGGAVGLEEEETLKRVCAYQETGLLRHIRGVFESRALGYDSVLVAARVDPSRVKAAAEVVSRHPGVSHNYGRAHWFNLWFTLATGPGESLDATVARLATDADLEHHRVLPMVRQFKIGVLFDLESDSQASSTADGTAVSATRTPLTLSDLDVALVRLLQEPLPLELSPFQSLSDEVGLSEGRFLAAVKDLLRRGAMRRYAGLLAHRTAGFRANAMVCWVVPEERVEEVGWSLASFSTVSHCYQRATYPDWPYNLFTMLHAPKRAACEAMAEEMAALVGVSDHALLLSTREFKKAPVRYFAEGAGATAKD